MLRKTALTALSMLALGVMACGDDTNGTTNPTPDAIFPDVIGGDTLVTPTDTVNPAAVRRLDFEMAFGDDSVPCRGTSRCTISLSFTERRTLKVLYTEDGQPAAGQVVKFALENDADGVGYLNTLSSVTDETGIGQVETKPKEGRVGQFVVKAYIDNSDLPALYFDVVVTPKGQVPLTVIGTYGGSRPVGNYNVRLYRQNAAGAPNCANLLDLYENGTASQARDNVQLTQTAKFPQFDGLEQDGTQKYTILAFALNSTSAIQAWGCEDVEGQVEWGKARTVTVELVDRPPLYAGAYNITSRFDFVSAIPDPYRTWVQYVVGFFQSPAGTVLTLACDLLTGEGEDLNSICDLVFDQDAQGHLTLSTVGGYVSDLIDSIIEGIAQGSVFGTIFQVGGDVADILKAFEINATLTFKNEPDATGAWTEAGTSENWHTVKVKWSLGANCDPATEVGCGTRQFSINTFQQTAVTGSFTASVADTWNLTIDKHPLNLHYGALINYFLEAFLLPLVTGQPVVDTYEELLGFLIGGGTSCLEPGSALDCCGTFSDNSNIAGNGDGTISGATEGAINTACGVITTAGPKFLRDTLQGLDLQTGDVFTIGTKTACPLTDFNNDMVVDGVGSQAAPCMWDVTLDFGGNATTSFDAIFFGARAE